MNISIQEMREILMCGSQDERIRLFNQWLSRWVGVIGKTVVIDGHAMEEFKFNSDKHVEAEKMKLKQQVSFAASDMSGQFSRHYNKDKPGFFDLKFQMYIIRNEPHKSCTEE